MSSSPSESSSSSSHPSRPLQERSSAETNRLKIRVVPYSPPKPEAEQGESSHARDSGAYVTASHAPGAFERKGSRGSALSSPSSPISPTTSLARSKGRGVSGSKLASGSSGPQHTSAPQTPALTTASFGSHNSRLNAPAQPASRDGRPALPSPAWQRAKSRRDNFINVHSDKTFSVVLKPTKPRGSGLRLSDRSTSPLLSPPLTNNSTVSSHERISFEAPTEDHPSSPFSSVPERSGSPHSPTTPTTPTEVPDSTPSNYRLIGGLRKVPGTPDWTSKGKGKEEEKEPPLPPLPDTCAESSRLGRNSSYASGESESTIEETANYEVIGRSSSNLPDFGSFNFAAPSSSVPNIEVLEPPSPTQPLPSSSSPNYQILGRSSPAQPATSSSARGSVALDTPGSRNYIVHPDATPASSIPTFARRPRRYSSDDSLRPDLRAQESQESLVVPPLNPRGRLLFSKPKALSHKKSRSWSSISSVFTQDTEPNFVRLQHTPSASSLQQSSWAAPAIVVSHQPRMDQHQWSSQLSTVPSEYEGSEMGSRVVSSIGSAGDRGSSAFAGSRSSRQVRSISSSILETLDPPPGHRHSRSNSRPDSLLMRGAREAPPGTPPLRMVRDIDEHGDGLADLQQLHQLQTKSSRGRLAGFLSRNSSNQSLHSTASSSRAGSLTSASIPAWARLYYGSGERRWLAAPSIRSDADSRPGSPWAPSVTPSHDQFEQNIRNPRKRPKEMPPHGRRPTSMEITPLGMDDMPRGPRKMTSSIWSPHLRTDRRRTSHRYSMFAPPSIAWSAGSGLLGKRNIQVALFVLGFGIPFAWMIAAFLPLPRKPDLEMRQRGTSTTQFYVPEEPEPLPREVAEIDDKSFQSARWWRNLNRFMSIVGLLVLGAVAALVVIGLRQNWAQ
ncbi:hypothetical protein GGR56DRAFT_290636 [Xylariaceae sp. FL0804]|nr:hypothetical protein GGR56DRAFT_290636 [Xylariaceae sp. FL0804]